MGKAFKIATFLSFSEPERLAEYAGPSRTSIEANGSRLMVRGLSPHGYENGRSERANIIEFFNVGQVMGA